MQDGQPVVARLQGCASRSASCHRDRRFGRAGDTGKFQPANGRRPRPLMIRPACSSGVARQEVAMLAEKRPADQPPAADGNRMSSR